MNKLTEFFKESNGNFSATRLAFLIWAFGVLIVWGVPSVRHGKLEPIPESVVVVIGMLMTGKVVQKINEPSNTSTSEVQAIGKTVQPITKDFDLEIALELGQLINNAYQQYEQRDHDSQSWTWHSDGYTIITTFEFKQNKDTVPFGFVAEKNGNAYVIFRGTRTASEWADNAEIKQTESQFIAG
jgi:hypothetical protein